MSILPILGGPSPSQPAQNQNQSQPQDSPGEASGSNATVQNTQPTTSGDTSDANSNTSDNSQTPQPPAPQNNTAVSTTDTQVAASVLSASLQGEASVIENGVATPVSLNTDDAGLLDARAQAEMYQRTIAMQRVIDSVQPLQTGPIGVAASLDPQAVQQGPQLQVAVPDTIPDQPQPRDRII